MERDTLVIGGLLAALLLSTGCTTSGLETIGKPEADHDKKHLVIHNETLANAVTIKSMRTRKVGNQLEVDVTLTNLTSRDKQVKYRFSWFDADEFQVEPDNNAWTPVTLHGAASVQLKALAPNATATSYKLNVREQ